MAKLRLMSQNQWNFTHNNDVWEKLGLDCSAEVRMRGHAQVFEELMPDVVGGQEVNIQMYYELSLNLQLRNLPYTLLWGYMTPIIYRADKLELLDTVHYTYPAEMEGFPGIYNDYRSKSFTLAVFRCKENGKVFIFTTTHLWWQNGKDPNCGWYTEGSDTVRKLQVGMAMDMIDEYQKKYDGCPVFFVGDLNADYNSEAVQYAMNERGYSPAHNIATEFVHEGVGYNDCKPSHVGKWWDAPFEESIDHILVRDYEGINIKRFDRYTPDYYVYLSDHAPAFVDIEF